MKKYCLQLAGLLVLSTHFAPLASADSEQKWLFELSFPMIWAADINGEIDLDGLQIDASKTFSEKLDELAFGYMVEFYAQKGRWNFALKANYEEAENSMIRESANLPPGLIPIVPSLKIKTEVQQGTNDAIIGYRLDGGLQLYTGVRHLFSKIDLEITSLEPGIIELDGKLNLADENLFDYLVGAEYRFELTPNWHLRLNADVAVAGDNDTDYSGNMVLNYQISELNNVWFGYRYLKIVNETVEGGVQVKSDFETQGPTIGWSFTF